MARVVVVGSSNTDMVVRLPRLPARGETRLGGAFATSPGGKGANQAVAARRAGAEVALVAAVGDDALGRQALDRYRDEGIDIGHMRTIPGVASGVALIFVDDRGENMIGVAPGANAHLAPAHIDALPESLFVPGAVLLASLEVPVATVVRALQRARAARMTTVLNPAPVDPAIADRAVLALVDVLTPNHEEARGLAGVAGGAPATGVEEEAREAACRLLAAGCRAVVVTMGSLGCLVATETGMRRVEAPAVAAVDTVGAGDAFSGALAVALGEGRTLAEAAAWACAAGALAVTRPGAQGASPLRGEIDRMAALLSAPLPESEHAQAVPSPGSF
jgi:ribokinase